MRGLPFLCVASVPAVGISLGPGGLGEDLQRLSGPSLPSLTDC